MIQNITNNTPIKYNTQPVFRGGAAEFSKKTKYLDKFLKSQRNPKRIYHQQDSYREL